MATRLSNLGCPIYHFKNLCAIFRHAALSLQHYYTPLSLGDEILLHKHVSPIKTESRYQLPTVRAFKHQLYPMNCIRVPASCAVCCTFAIFHALFPPYKQNASREGYPLNMPRPSSGCKEKKANGPITIKRKRQAFVNMQTSDAVAAG